jgi:hypothetical protein
VSKDSRGRDHRTLNMDESKIYATYIYMQFIFSPHNKNTTYFQHSSTICTDQMEKHTNLMLVPVFCTKIACNFNIIA